MWSGETSRVGGGAGVGDGVKRWAAVVEADRSSSAAMMVLAVLAEPVVYHRLGVKLRKKRCAGPELGRAAGVVVWGREAGRPRWPGPYTYYSMGRTTGAARSVCLSGLPSVSDGRQETWRANGDLHLLPLSCLSACLLPAARCDSMCDYAWPKHIRDHGRMAVSTDGP